MADVKWIKLTTDIFDDEKILMIEALPSADTIIVIWFKLLAFAGKSNNNGVFMMSNRIPYTEEMLAAIFRRDTNTVKLALKTFEQFGMIEIIDDVITIPNWDKHQSLDAYEKKKERDRRLQAERRARQKALIGESSDNRLTSDEQCNDGQMTVAVSEEEEEKDKEKESHSFILSREEDEEGYIERKVAESGLEGEDAEEYKNEVKERLKVKVLQGKLGKGVVRLSGEQIDDLLDKLSIDEFNKYVEIVADCELNGKPYRKKTHYQAILDMANKDRRVKKG
jgi:predicted phage replisome organizer